jgi:hypothetical protein
MDITEKDGIPIVKGIITINNRALHAQTYTLNGYRRDECCEGFKDSLLRGDHKQACFWFKEFFDLGKIYISYISNIMVLFYIKNIGLANPYLIIKIKTMFDNIKFIKDDIIKERKYTDLIKSLCKSKKSRLTYNIVQSFMLKRPKKLPEELNYLPLNVAFNIDYDLKDGDVKKLKKPMSGFINAIKYKREIDAIYWAEKVFNLKDNNKNFHKTYKGMSTDPMYNIWEEIVNVTNNDEKDKKVINHLLYYYDNLKNGRQERYIIAFAILYLCRYKDYTLRSINFNRLLKECEIKTTDQEWEFIKTHTLIPIKEHYINYSTKRGKKLNKVYLDYVRNMEINNLTKELKDSYFNNVTTYYVSRQIEGINILRKKKRIAKEKLKKRKKNKKISKKRKRDNSDLQSSRKRIKV